MNCWIELTTAGGPVTVPVAEIVRVVPLDDHQPEPGAEVQTRTCGAIAVPESNGYGRLKQKLADAGYTII